LHRFSVFSLRNRALIALVTIVVAVFGGITLTMLKQELIPSISLPQLFIVSSYPGASPAVVEHDVSTPIEDAIQTIPGLQDTTATSSANVSNINATFDYSTDLAQAEEKITTAINRIKSTLPDGVDPQVIQFSLSDIPIIQVGATSGLSATELSDRLDRLVVPELSKLDGVASVALQGDRGQEIDITPDAAKMAAAGVTAQAIQTALQQNGLLLPAGSITADGQTLNVQAGVRIGSADELAAIPLVGARPAGGDPANAGVVTIGDVATVALVDQPITGYSRVNGEDALTLSVTKTSTGNTVAVSDEVLDRLDELAASVGGDTTFTVVFNQAPFITQSIESLTQEGLLGLVFAVIVILIFLLSIRSTLVTAVSIPTSVLLTFIGMWASNYTLNIITLGGLTIAIGRVVDDSIVVVENIKRHLEFGEEKKQAILTAVREVAGAVTASTITTIAVFLPIGLVGDEVGELFRPFAVTVGIALLSSLLVALTIVPVLAYWFLGRPKRKPSAAHTGEIGHVEEKPSLLQRGYLPIIRWTLKYPAVIILLAIFVLGGSLALIPRLQLNFIGSSGQNTVTVTETFDAGTSLDTQNTASKKVESALRDVAGVDTVQTSVGSGGGGLAAAFGSSNGATFSLTTDPDADQAGLQDTIKTVLAGIPDAGKLEISTSSGFGSDTVDVTVHAPDDATLQQAVGVVEDAVKDLPSVSKVSDNIAASLPYVAVQVDRAKAAEHGLSEAAVGALVMSAMNPSAVGSVTISDSDVSVYIKDADAPTTLDELQAFTVPTATGPVALTEIATVQRSLSPAAITSEQGVRTATVSLTPASADTGATTFAVTGALDGLDLPSGASVETGGVASQMLDSFGQLGWALLAAILIVYVVMVATFKSLRQPLLLLVSIPFAATGAILLQVATNIPLGVSSLIGVLMLVGIVVTNAIVLVDLVNQYRAAGMDARTAVEQGAARRLRPILMTAAATIFALIPLATGLTGHGGGFISQPLAIIVIGGLISSTVLTLLVLPALYYLVEGRRERRAPALAAKAERKQAKRAEHRGTEESPTAATGSRRERRQAGELGVGPAAIEAESTALAAAAAGAEPLPEVPAAPLVLHGATPAAPAAAAEPEVAEPGAGEPGDAEPRAGEPGDAEPGAGEPGDLAEPPSSEPYALADESVESTAPVVPPSRSAQPTTPLPPATPQPESSFPPSPSWSSLPPFPAFEDTSPPAAPGTTAEPVSPESAPPGAPAVPVAPAFPVAPIEPPPAQPLPPARPFTPDEPADAATPLDYEPIESVWSSVPDPAAPGAPQPPGVPQPPVAPETPSAPPPAAPEFPFPASPVEPIIPAPAPEPTVPSEPEPVVPAEPEPGVPTEPEPSAPSEPGVPPPPTQPRFGIWTEPVLPDWRTQPPPSPEDRQA